MEGSWASSSAFKDGCWDSEDGDWDFLSVLGEGVGDFSGASCDEGRWISGGGDCGALDDWTLEGDGWAG